LPLHDACGMWSISSQSGLLRFASRPSHHGHTRWCQRKTPPHAARPFRFRSAFSGMAQALESKGRAHAMSLTEKTKNAGDKVKGAANEIAGRMKDDPHLKGEGKAERAVADLKQAGEKLKDAFRQ
jgi:uncharacterized protein YjbJ (UPF0337 family)